MNVAAAFNIQIEYLFWFKNAFCNLTHFLFIQPQNKHFLPKVGWVGRQGTLRSEKQREFERRQVKTLAGRGIRKGGKPVEPENLMVGLMNSMSLCLSVGNKKQDAFVVSSFCWLENSVDDRGILWGDLEKNYLSLSPFSFLFSLPRSTPHFLSPFLPLFHPSLSHPFCWREIVKKGMSFEYSNVKCGWQTQSG